MHQSFDTQTFQQFVEERMNKLYNDHILNKAWKEVISRVKLLISQKDFLNKEARRSFALNEVQELSGYFNRDIFLLVINIDEPSEHFQFMQPSGHYRSDSQGQKRESVSRIRDAPRNNATFIHSLEKKTEQHSYKFPTIHDKVKEGVKLNREQTLTKRHKSLSSIKQKRMIQSMQSIQEKSKQFNRTNVFKTQTNIAHEVKQKRLEFKPRASIQRASDGKIELTKVQFKQQEPEKKQYEEKTPSKLKKAGLTVQRAANIPRLSRKGSRDDQPNSQSSREV